MLAVVIDTVTLEPVDEVEAEDWPADRRSAVLSHWEWRR